MSDQIDIRDLRKSKISDTDRKSAVDKAEKKLYSFFNTDIQLFGSGLPDKVKESFYNDLGSLLEAGVDIRTTLELISGEYKKKKIKTIINEVSSNVISGTTLAEALRKTNQFSSYEYFSLQIGEETGKLVTILKELGVFYQNKIKQYRQIVGALTYPIVILLVAIGAVSFMMTFVVPMFSDIFKRFGKDLPAVTKFIISVSFFIKQYSAFVFAIVAFMLFFIWTQRKKVWFRKYSSIIILKTPVTGPLIKKVYLTRLANTMALLTGSRIPIIQSLRLTSKMIGFYPFEESLLQIEEKVLLGYSLHKALSEFPIYPDKFVSMIKVGEEVNQLEAFFSRISKQYAAEAEHETSVLGKFLEPVIIILLGVVVGIILIAMYLPLFKLGQTF